MVGYWIYILRIECILRYQMPLERIPRMGRNEPSGNFVAQTSVTFLILLPHYLGIMIRGVHHPFCMRVNQCWKTPESFCARSVFTVSHSSRYMGGLKMAARGRKQKASLL
jgi:hypothetical protein